MQEAAALQLEIRPLRQGKGGGPSMDRCRKHPIRHHPGPRYASVVCAVSMLNVLPGCITTKAAPEMAWVRTDGRRITDDPALLRLKGKSDIALCRADHLMLDRRMKRRAPAWASAAIRWFQEGIRLRKCVRRTLTAAQRTGTPTPSR